MPSPTDFNLSPYYDDFTESKKFHRILFRPSFAVQARELTQSQTILQNQIERMGDHFFKQGAMVIPGQVGLDLDYYAVKLSAKSVSTISSYVGATLTGATSGVVATCINAVATDGTDPDTLYVKYEKTGTNNSTVVFDDGETINCVFTDSTLATATVDTTAVGSAVGVKQGVYYINGFYVQCDDETLILDKYTNTPSYRIGFTVTESFITPNDDATLNDNAAGSSNVNAPGAHRFKILLSLAKKTLSSTEDSSFYELMRVENGIIRAQARGTEYNILQDTLARRTFDESGDYTLTNPDFDVREHLVSGNNRGIYTSGNGGDETKLAIGVSPFKAYVKGYENQILATTFLDVNKARDFDTQNNFKTRFNVKNYVNVTNVYGSPDITTVSGVVEAFKSVNLYNDPTDSRGTEVSTVGVDVPQIGRAKTKGFEFVTGSETSDIFGTSSTFRQYLFDIEMFQHLNTTTSDSYTTGEIVSGATSGATGVVMSDTATVSTAVTTISVASPGVVTLNSHGLTDGQQITLSGGSFQIDSTAYTEGVYTVRNATTNTFELYGSDGTTAQNVTSFSSAPTVSHTTIVVSNVNGTFEAGEIVTGQSSNASTTIQSNTLGFKGVREFDFPEVKQIGMAGSPTYTADTVLTSTYGDNTSLVGNVSIANSDATLLGKGTSFNTDLKIGDQITFLNDAGSSITKRVKYIVSNTELELDSNVGGSDVTTAAIVTRQRAKLQNPENNISVFKLPYTNIKTLKTTDNSGLSDTNYNFRKNFSGTLTSNGDIQLTAGSNEVFASQNDTDIVVTITATGAGTTGAVGDVLNTSGNNHEGDSIYNLGGSPSGKTLTLDFGADFQGHTVKVLATVSKSVGDSKTKTLNSNETVSISSQSIIESGTIGLGKADIYQINNVYMSANFSTNATSSDTDITSRFDLDTGQRDNFYDIGRLKLKPGQLKPTGRILIDFDYFSHGAGGDYFDVDSYSGVVNYENIPSYTSDTTGIKYELRDSLDFRPRVDDASTIPGSTSGSDFERSYDGTGASTVNVIEFDSDITSDFEYYLNRIDKIFLTRDGELKVLEGASALNPLRPGNIDGTLHLATLRIPSYTLNTSDVIVEKEDNKRFTMRDIGRLEKRLQNVEYYTQLSLLEADAQSLQIQDADGFDRFKNGFVVDNFTGHNVGDVGNNDYKLAIDRARGEARTPYNSDVVELEEVDDDGTVIASADRTSANYAKTGDLLTLPYTETTLIEQPYATKTENLNPFLVFDWVGNIELDPPLDEWKETEVAPDLVVNLNGTFDNLLQDLGLQNTNTSSVPVSTEWNEWQDQWSGNPRTTTTTSGRTTTTTTTVDVIQTRNGIRTDIVPQTVTQSLGERVVSVNFVPFIRSRDITFTARGLRPNTQIYPFFDNEDVSSYVTPDGGVAGGNIVTDANGTAVGVFSIPDPKDTANPKWRTGTRVFRLTSSSTNADLSASATATSAEADYSAKGLQETVQEAIISTREIQVVRTSVSETRQIDRVANQTVVTRPDRNDRDRFRFRFRDPLAQSFLIDEADGVFVTSVNAYFATKSDTIPVRAEIRKMSNGYPTSSVVPFSQKYLNPSSVNTSSDASLATTFTFDSPVYLQEGSEYALILYSDSTDYTAYVARLGDTVIGSDRTVSSQPATGVLFKSANYSTWEPEQMEDLKFTLNKAVFDTTTSGTITLANKALSSKTLQNNPIRTFNGTGLVRVYHKNHGLHSTNDNVTIAGLSSGTYNGIAHSDINGDYTSIKNITLDSYDIETGGTATSSGDVGSTTVTATQNRLFDVLQLQIGHVIHPNTSLSSNLRTTSGKSVHGEETAFTRQGVSAAQSVVLGDNIYFDNPRAVLSEINEKNELGAGATSRNTYQSMFVNLTISSSNANLSPVIDLKRLNAFAISNRLNNPLVSTTDTFTGDGSTTAFTLSSSPTSVHLLAVKKNGEKLQPVDDFTVSGTTLTFTSAPASGAKIVAKLTNTVDYEDDTATEGGSAAGVYITKKVSLANPSTALEVRVAASVRSTSSIRAYYRVSGGEETRRLEDIPYTPFNTDGSSDVNIDPSTGDVILDNNFRDYKFSDTGIHDFTSFQIKIVFTGTVSAVPARLKDFRAIALAV